MCTDIYCTNVIQLMSLYVLPFICTSYRQGVVRAYQFVSFLHWSFIFLDVCCDIEWLMSSLDLICLSGEWGSRESCVGISSQPWSIGKDVAGLSGWSKNPADHTHCFGGVPPGGVSSRGNHSVVHSSHPVLQPHHQSKLYHHLSYNHTTKVSYTTTCHTTTPPK